MEWESLVKFCFCFTLWGEISNTWILLNFSDISQQDPSIGPENRTGLRDIPGEPPGDCFQGRVVQMEDYSVWLLALFPGWFGNIFPLTSKTCGQNWAPCLWVYWSQTRGKYRPEIDQLWQPDCEQKPPAVDSTKTIQRISRAGASWLLPSTMSDSCREVFGEAEHAFPISRNRTCLGWPCLRAVLVYRPNAQRDGIKRYRIAYDQVWVQVSF